MDAKELLQNYLENEKKTNNRLKADSGVSETALCGADSRLTQIDSANRIKEIAHQLVVLEGLSDVQINRSLEDEFNRAAHRLDLVAVKTWADRIEKQLRGAA